MFASRPLVFQFAPLRSLMRINSSRRGVSVLSLVSLTVSTVRRAEAVENLECCGSKVMGVSCDGAASNRNFFRMHGSEVSGDGVLYKTTNFYSKEKRWLYFCSDVPHLIKTTRNCWSHSHEKGKTRSMAVSSHPSLYSFMQYLKCSIQINNKRITWNHLVTLYKRSQATREPAGLYLLKTLKLEHVQLNSYSRMRVDLAAQVRIRVIGKPFLWIISMIPFCRL